jgi:hypothetical protein
MVACHTVWDCYSLAHRPPWASVHASNLFHPLWSLGVLGWTELAPEPASLHLPSIDPQGELQRGPCFPLQAECGTLEDNVGQGWGGTQIPMLVTGGPSVKCQCQKHSDQPLTNPDILDQSLFFSCLSFLIWKIDIHSSACTKGHP